MAIAKKVTINIPVADAVESVKLLSALFDCDVVIEDGAKYALVNLGGVRVAFVSGQEDIVGGRAALAVEVGDPVAVTNAAESFGLPTRKADHPSSRAFFVTRMPGAMDVVFYAK